MGDVKVPLHVPPSQALVGVIDFVWLSEGFEVLSLRHAKHDVYCIRVVAFLDYVMSLVEIEFLDGWASFHDLSCEDAVVFHHFVRSVASSCFPLYKSSFPEVNLIADLEGIQDESLESLEIQASFLLHQATGMLASSKATQLDAARTLARCAGEPRRCMVIGFEVVKVGDSISGFIRSCLLASRDLATLQASYPILAMLKSVSSHPIGADLLGFLLPLRNLVCTTDCSLLMRTFRELLNQISERASLQEAVKEENQSSLTPTITPSRMYTSSTNCSAQSRTYTSSTDCRSQSLTSTSSSAVDPTVRKDGGGPQ